MSQWWIYIVRCNDGTLYTGITTEINRRMIEHNAGKGSKYVRGRTPVMLVWSEQVENRSVASKLEYKIKYLGRTLKERMIEQSSVLVPLE